MQNKMNKFNALYDKIIKEAKEKIKNKKKFLEENEVETEEGEVASAGITTNSVFGEPSGYPSIVQPKEKTIDDPGVSTKDIKEIYTPSITTPCIRKFKRVRKKNV